MDAGVPTTFGITKCIYELLVRDAKGLGFGGYDLLVMKYLCAKLSAKPVIESILANTPPDNVDIEAVLNAANALAQKSFKTSNLSVFAAGWDPAIEELRALVLPYAHDDRFTLFVQYLNYRLADLTWIRDKDAYKANYLASLFNILDSQDRLVIATLNYDNSVELMAQRAGIPCQTAIEAWSSGYPDSLSLDAQGLNLLKLHGSIDWVAKWSSNTSGIITSVNKATEYEIIGNSGSGSV